MTQGNLFDIHREPLVEPLARNTDPGTSHEAAANLAASGKHSSQLERVYEAIRSLPNPTAGEIAQSVGMDRHTVSKRTADLVRLGRVRKGEPRVCEINRTKMVTWVLGSDPAPHGRTK